MLKGQRLLLRPMTLDDVSKIHEFYQDIELYGLDSAAPRTTTWERTRSIFEDYIRDDVNKAVFAIEVEQKFIGFCSLMHLQQRHGNLELGITIGDRAYWGQGYGRETIKLMLHYAFHYLGARRIELTTHAKNERAIRCYRACGFVEEGRPRQVVWIEGEYVDLVNMGVLRSEWQATQDNPL